jgi:hypothetical protein
VSHVLEMSALLHNGMDSGNFILIDTGVSGSLGKCNTVNVMAIGIAASTACYKVKLSEIDLSLSIHY